MGYIILNRYSICYFQLILFDENIFIQIIKSNKFIYISNIIIFYEYFY